MYICQVGADDPSILDKIIDSLTSLSNNTGKQAVVEKEQNKLALTVGKIQENGATSADEARKKKAVLILGAGRVCRPAAELLASAEKLCSYPSLENCFEVDLDGIQVIVASLYLKEAEEVGWKKR